jgi:hypothetical protein
MNMDVLAKAKQVLKEIHRDKIYLAIQDINMSDKERDRIAELTYSYYLMGYSQCLDDINPAQQE